MTTATLEQRSSIDLVSHDAYADAAAREDTALPARDMRLTGLGPSGRRLGMQIADLGPLQVRRAKADLVHCPICPGH